MSRKREDLFKHFVFKSCIDPSWNIHNIQTPLLPALVYVIVISEMISNHYDPRKFVIEGEAGHYWSSTI